MFDGKPPEKKDTMKDSHTVEEEDSGQGLLGCTRHQLLGSWGLRAKLEVQD